MLEKQEVFTFAAYRPRFGFCLIHLSVTAIYETTVLALMLRLNPPFFRLPTVFGPLIWIAGWPVDKLLSRRADWILARHSGPLDQANLYHRHFLPCLEAAALPRVNFHAQRRTLGASTSCPTGQVLYLN